MALTQTAFDDVARLVTRRTGLNFANHIDNMEQGIQRAMGRAKVADAARYLDLIVSDNRVLDDLIDELTIGETYFFREPEQFDFIRGRVLPDILKRRGREHVIRAWSAGTASGEEVFSLAILFEEEGLGEQSYLLGTDISCQALAKARRGIYGEWSLRGRNRKAALPYLISTRNSLRLDKRIHGRVTFASLNLALDVYPSFANGTWGMDLILCRNVLIYLHRETVRQVAQRLYSSLAEGGWLITASSDPPVWEDAPFDAVTSDAGVFYRRPIGLDPCSNNGQPEIATSEVIAENTALEAREKMSAVHDNQPPASEPQANALETAAQGSCSRVTDPFSDAQRSFVLGNYHSVVEMTQGLDTSSVATLHVRALANLDLSEAEQACASATVQFPLAVELHYLHAVLLLNLGRDPEAIAAVRRVIYLDRSLAVAHFTLGSILRRRGELAGARRAYRNTLTLCAGHAAGDPLPLGDGEPAGRLAEAAGRELALLETPRGGP